MSKYSDKTFEKILDDMCRRVKECSTMEGSFIYTAFALFVMELALFYMRLGRDEDNGYADTADYEHIQKKHLQCFFFCTFFYQYAKSYSNLLKPMIVLLYSQIGSILKHNWTCGKYWHSYKNG